MTAERRKLIDLPGVLTGNGLRINCLVKAEILLGVEADPQPRLKDVLFTSQTPPDGDYKLEYGGKPPLNVRVLNGKVYSFQ